MVWGSSRCAAWGAPLCCLSTRRGKDVWKAPWWHVASPRKLPGAACLRAPSLTCVRWRTWRPPLATIWAMPVEGLLLSWWLSPGTEQVPAAMTCWHCFCVAKPVCGLLGAVTAFWGRERHACSCCCLHSCTLKTLLKYHPEWQAHVATPSVQHMKLTHIGEKHIRG